ncbi:tyrocidine synthase 1 [Thermoclostridium stercorarium subsp. stercorarium DSM 8532]|jgi:D-alanine--poly(phosphoribitol) ligase subunit 1|uniref:Tyrocidine synthase 1 n=3 Tax=Thermoclostridium stercorarium TaxID=1510 RepID=L7VPG1_THES1|nr:AMP-binding protein [Thermoclostridium stercorarium]AGC68652.1 tyrocidine synthase 1 [Thermoclostridium stercorarium subsp. stercorarium DSM 8532]AGI39664.1 peptide synthetase [Thermoclostridium stercorarium subsp. stercorarium DSM 8532]ANW98992.1 AMP-dependent synthetase [Thermoclostridium stercorarium subsp. thermolacticum DSM 2910]ANX01521.1 AMP-dependent synthetase [Thermoclostridium stercorarium subsp. leptospartum DSM 9219]
MGRQINILEYLENIVKIYPDKICYANESEGYTFRQVYNSARAVGTFLHHQGHYRKPVVVFMKKHPKEIIAFLGVVYSGNYYVPIDEEMPVHRIELIFANLLPEAVICDKTTADLVKKFNYDKKVYLYDDIVKTNPDDKALQEIFDKTIDTDPIYVVFTSGSTGVPKGVVACHRSVIDYIESFSEVLGVSSDTVFGNQTPLYVDASLKEIYPTLKFGATAYIIPKELFMFPIKLVEFLNEKKINTICWVVPALTMISGLGVFEKIKPKYLHTIAFGSEVFPMKQFLMWRKALPDAKFINLYGPTEATGMSCYYIVDREFTENDVIPIGKPFKNTDIILLNDENKPVTAPNEPGEICIRGTSLTLGYYRDFERTNEVFVQNPLNDLYPELIYRTGDIGKYNERGELVFVSRKDYQIKHMGHRIELGEIEAAVGRMDGIVNACCIFDDVNKKIVLYYTGVPSRADVINFAKEKLPRYMLPHIVEKLDVMPLTANGKINRLLLKEKYMDGKKG